MKILLFLLVSAVIGVATQGVRLAQKVASLEKAIPIGHQGFSDQDIATDSARLHVEIGFLRKELAEIGATAKAAHSTASKISDRELEKVALERMDSMTAIAEKYAGTKDEAFGRERALWHAKKIWEIGPYAGYESPQAMVEICFSVALKEKSEASARGR